MFMELALVDQDLPEILHDAVDELGKGPVVSSDRLHEELFEGIRVATAGLALEVAETLVGVPSALHGVMIACALTGCYRRSVSRTCDSWITRSAILFSSTWSAS